MKREMISEELIDKVLAGKGSADEAKSVSSWLGTDEGQLYLASHMDLMLEETLSDPEEEGGIPTYNMYEEIQNKIRERSRTLSLVNWAAALAVLLALSLFVGERFLHFSPKSFSAENSCVPRGEKMTFLLGDGTKAVVNSDTRFGYPRRFGIGKRVVSLEGEAFFDVAKSWFRPFIIRLGDAEVRVYGTQFNVKAYPEENMITVGMSPWLRVRCFHSTRKHGVIQWRVSTTSPCYQPGNRIRSFSMIHRWAKWSGSSPVCLMWSLRSRMNACCSILSH